MAHYHIWHQLQRHADHSFDVTRRVGATIVHWTPSPAVCGIDFYTGLKFPRWNGNLFVTALAGQHLRRLVVDSCHVIDQEVLLQDIGRVRDVASGPDGMLYLVLNRPGKVVRLVPLE